MGRNYEMVFGRDGKGQLHTARVPAGIVKPGMMVRLVGGVFLLAELVCDYEPVEGVPVYAAAQILQPVWCDGDG